MDYLQALEADYRRFAEVTAGDQTAVVPTCPQWQVADLVSHVAHVYLHKAECMRLGAMPDPWPPQPTGETPRQMLERAHATLTAEFAARSAHDAVPTWFDPDHTVGFWRRRMAQETVIHRIDAELAAGEVSHRVSDDLAFDGIDEVLKIFLAWSSRKWPEEFTEALSKGDGAVLVAARWLVFWDGTGVTTTDSASGGDASVSGSPDGVLRWLWRRADDEAVQLNGDHAKLAQMRELLRIATQ